MQRAEKFSGLDRVVRESLTEKVMLGQRLKGVRKLAMIFREQLPKQSL